MRQSHSIVLLGPSAAGKSTVGRLLAEALQMPFCDLPAAFWEYWQAAGFDNDRCIALARQGGFEARLGYLAPFEVFTLERGLEDHPGSVIEVGPLQAVQDQPELARRVQAALAPYPHVILLQPSPDSDESERILSERGTTICIEGRELDEHFLMHRSNFELAKQTLYTKDKTPQQSCEEILERMTPGSDIILIGPMNCGKSTLGSLLAQRLGLPNVSMDAVRWNYYQEVGWSHDEQERIEKEEGFAGVYRYWKRFELHAVGRLLEEHKNCVIDFGAGHSVYEDDAQRARAREMLASYPNVFLLLPSSDLQESLTILRERSGSIRGGMAVNRFFLTRLAQSWLAKQVVYTAGKTPEQTCDEIINLCGLEE